MHIDDGRTFSYIQLYNISIIYVLIVRYYFDLSKIFIFISYYKSTKNSVIIIFKIIIIKINRFVICNNL